MQTETSNASLSVLDRARRKPREEPQHPWSMNRQGEPWNDKEKARLRVLWPQEGLETEEIAMALARSVASVAQQAHAMSLGARPKAHTSGSGLVGKPKASKPFQRKEPADANAAKMDETQPVKLLPTIDGVVMTKRLEFAWGRVEAGDDVAQVAREERLTTTEYAALRRWSAAA